MQSANPSLGELKRETEQTRAGLTRTVEELRSSVSATASDVRQWLSPESIKAEVSDYVRSRGERLVEDLTAAARRNPMQAVAMGAGIAYPLLRHAAGRSDAGAWLAPGFFCRLQGRPIGDSKGLQCGIGPLRRAGSARPRPF
jgi:hypothetical protein